MDELDRKLHQFHYPYDDLDWRWQRARALVKAGREPLTHRDDGHIKRAVNFLQDMMLIGDQQLSNYELSARYPFISQALNLRQHRGKTRCYLEALLLCSDASIEDIGKYICDAHTGGMRMVRTYERLFMDIRSHLANPVYVHTKVVEPIMIQHMTAGDDPDLAWKLGGIYGGKDVVKAFWELGAGTAELLEWFSGTTFKNMSRKLAFGSFFMPSNQHTLVQIGEFIQRTAELEIKRSTAGMLEDHENKHVELMRQMIGSMQKMVTVGKKLDHPDGYETRVYDGLVQHVLHPERYGEVEKEVDAVVSGG